MRMRKIRFLGNCSGVQQTAGASAQKMDRSGAYPNFIHSLSSPHPRKSTASFPSPRLFRPSLPSPGLFRLSTKVASPDHHKTTTSLDLELKARSRSTQQGESREAGQERRKQGRCTKSLGSSSPGSASSSSAPATTADTRGSMENVWQGMGNSSQPIGEVNYTPGIDIGEVYMPTEQQLNNLPPDGSENMNTAMPAQPSAPEARRKGTSKRLKNFSTKEDESLCSAYINVSKDPIVGTNQPIRSYWGRIKAYFEEDSERTRSQSSLQHRWADIQKDTSRFCGFYSEIERKNQSGKSDGDKVKDALQMYEGIVGTTFKFIHCWFILRNEMKWNEWLATTSASNEEPAVQPVEENVDPTLPPRIDRPNGRDNAKKARNSTSSSSAACFEVLQKMSMDRSAYEEWVQTASEEEAKEIASRSERKLTIQEEQLQIQKAQVEVQKEMLQLQKEDREERIMTMGVEKMQSKVFLIEIIFP
ncbi:hypothetical protein PVAP13_1KG262015 [Panicum virgatum]|uniref:No apical meristem-associated C-terminal domain-containing protein n=1 Tax=Panicum virgatum TaxID=38727 RepID=A0A8T0XV80_PANVG|nr:hypothetical protein PVAP13_1KG262015 [Panicum virgatum]